MISSLGS
jgi:hypothetical protein